MNKKMRIFRLLASHPIFLFKLNKSGFDECYQMENLKIKNPVFMRVCGPSYPLFAYSHSIVAGGLEVMS